MTMNMGRALITATLIVAQGMAQTPAAPTSDFAAAQKQYARLCEGCHGEGGHGGDRAPALVNNPSLRTRNEAQIGELIRNGTPGGMPAFKLPEGELQALAQWLHSLNISAFDTTPAGDVRAGEAFFFGKGQCATCHMVHGRERRMGPIYRPSAGDRPSANWSWCSKTRRRKWGSTRQRLARVGRFVRTRRGGLST
jgi:mono/diheme cytochrome c family protein